MVRRPRTLRLALVATGAIAATTAVSGGVATVSAAAAVTGHVARPIPAVAGHFKTASLAYPPTTAQCQTLYGINCYSPNQLRAAYNMPALFAKGDTGKGKTIAIVDSFGSPTIQHDLDVFDKTYGLPKTTVTIIQPAGQVPQYDNSDDQYGWAFETTLDVEYAHTFAPDAKILLVETPVSETEGVQGFPEIVKAENYVIKNHLATVISQSFGATEQTFPTAQSLLDLRSAFKNAAAAGITVLGASGDDGATDAESDGSTLYPMPVNSWPSSDPLVTSIGGTELYLDANGNRTKPDSTWNDGYGAGGGGLSVIFKRPVFQDGVKNVVGVQRGTPDISMTAAVDGGAVVYITADPSAAGYHIVGGTSEATPIFAGVVADAAQAAGHDLGNINASLYGLLTKKATKTGLVDVTVGDNSFNGVTGYPATAGYDLATGVGTINAATFVPALAAS